MWAYVCSKPNNQGEGSRDTNPIDAEDDQAILAETGVTLSEGIGQKNGRDAMTPETITSSNQGGSEEFQQSSDDYNFLNHTKEMTALDRFFVQHYAPYVHKWRRAIVSTFLIASIILGILAWLNFSLYDGTIIIFKEKYNLGRVQRVVDLYFHEDLIKMYLDEGLDYVGDNDELSAVGSGSVSGSGSGIGSSILDFIGSGSADKPTTSPTSRPSCE